MSARSVSLATWYTRDTNLAIAKRGPLGAALSSTGGAGHGTAAPTSSNSSMRSPCRAHAVDPIVAAM
jgi:hypothetical protein